MMQYVFADDIAAAEHFERGHALQLQKRFTEAIVEYDKVFEFENGEYTRYARWNKGMALLALGDYQQGFIHHDIAWELFDWGGFGPLSAADYKRLTSTLPRWYGQEDITGKRLLIYHEMGHGDALQGARYLSVLRERTAHLTLVTLLPLVELLRRLDIEVTAQLPNNLDRYDWRLPCLGAMRALDQTVENVPNKPYIPDVHWRRQRGKVGIAWSGRTQKMFSLQRFLSLFDRRNFELYALQLGPTIDGVEPLASPDFDDTARLVEQLEHVVTVDTAAAHLAGAMGHPSVHLILPYLQCWRWYRGEVWYPTMNFYRQETPGNFARPEASGDWSQPFAKLNEALHGSTV